MHGKFGAVWVFSDGSLFAPSLLKTEVRELDALEVAWYAFWPGVSVWLVFESLAWVEELVIESLETSQSLFQIEPSKMTSTSGGKDW